MDSIVVGRDIQRTKPKLNSEIGKTNNSKSQNPRTLTREKKKKNRRWVNNQTKFKIETNQIF